MVVHGCSRALMTASHARAAHIQSNSASRPARTAPWSRARGTPPRCPPGLGERLVADDLGGGKVHQGLEQSGDRSLVDYMVDGAKQTPLICNAASTEGYRRLTSHPWTANLFRAQSS